MKVGLTTVVDKVAKTVEAIGYLASRRVMVGVTGEKAGRRDGSIDNASLAYIHENGAPEVGIPARPFLRPGVQDVQPRIVSYLNQAMTAALDGNKGKVERIYNAVGLVAQNSIRGKITAGLSPPLADSTLRARARRGRKGAKLELKSRAGGAAPGIVYAKPLLDTGQLRAAITYVVRTVR